jgi:hypothetical protein
MLQQWGWHTSALGEDDAEHVSKCREGDEDGKDTLGTFAEHVSEEGGGYNTP